MREATIGTLRARFVAIDRRLTNAAENDGPDTREAIKAEIIALFRAVEKEIADLSSMKEEIRGLVEKWKGLRPEASSAPAPSLAAPVRVDHIGASTFIEKGWSRISLGDHEAAEQALTRALELSPEDAQALSLLGWAQMMQDKFDEALGNFQRVLMRQPANALARVNLGYICLKKGIFGEAIEHLSKAIRLDNDAKATLYAHYYLGLVYFEREMYDDAQTFFRKSLTLGPNLIEARFELGRALWRSGERDQALQAWRDGAAANKFNPWGTRCAEVVRTVEEGGSPP
jgi:tetratricopeptide (TPR) repeat protein